MTKSESYVKKYLAAELAEVEALPIAEVDNGLSVYEKTLIYHYTKDGYVAANAAMRNGKPSEFTTLLTRALRKLPRTALQVYRTCVLDASAIARYEKAMRLDRRFRERTFVSTSRSSAIGRSRPKYTVKFQIVCKSGRKIDDMSFVPSELEVLLLPGCEFVVEDVTQHAQYTLIRMTEQ